MICVLREGADASLLRQFQEQHSALRVVDEGRTVFVLPSKVMELDERYLRLFERVHVSESDVQLASRSYRPEIRRVQFGNVELGGARTNMAFIAGPCSVESKEQLFAVCDVLVECGISTLRGGAFKPRTSPYSFQGLGPEGLSLLDEARRTYGLSIVSEVRDATHVDAVLDVVDVIQIGAKAMYDQGILRACGRSSKPVLLKRGFGSTLQEFVQAAEFILSSGNEQVVLCERGIRTFETKTRFTLDLCGVSYLKQHVNLPIVVDPSHAMGYRYGVPDLSLAATALGVDGLLIEAHPSPAQALSDAAQQIELGTLKELFGKVQSVAQAVGKTVV